MLKGIDPLLSGDTLRLLDLMGHGDRVVVVDANFPAFSQARRVVHMGAGAERAMEAILSVLPLDTGEDHPVQCMVADSEPAALHKVHNLVLDAVRGREPRVTDLGLLPRSAFYVVAQTAFAAVVTQERAPYANFVLTKGVL